MKLPPAYLKYSILILCLTLCFALARAQNSPSVDNYDMGELDLVFHPFGMDNKVFVGTMNASGEFMPDFPDIPVESVRNAETFLLSLESAFNIYCTEELDKAQTGEEGKATNFGYLYLYDTKGWKGLIIGASSQKLYDHLLDDAYNDAVPGSYLQWFYASEDMTYTSTCKENVPLFSGGEAEVVKEYNLNMKQGANLILFEIQDVVEVKDAAAMASKIRITTIDAYPEEMIWFLKRF